MDSMFQLTGKNALVTGSGRGMGLGIARALAKQGARVAINDFYQDRADSAAVQLRSEGYDVIGVAADITDPHQLKEMIFKVTESFGNIDIFVANAGVPTLGMGYGSFLESDPIQWQQFLNLNLISVMHAAQFVVPGMIERKWGRFISITSESWRAGVPMGIAAYAASKAGCVGFIRQLAAETGQTGVTVNALSLGTMNNWDGSEKIASKSCLVPRAGSPDDVGAGVVYLASKEASWVTGQVYPLNGGSLTA